MVEKIEALMYSKRYYSIYNVRKLKLFKLLKHMHVFFLNHPGYVEQNGC
ncbi:MAG: hypothetical protein J7J43_02460 [Thermosipho sp. (in: Bacteria)]|nr:hypothetical protein [Thermosipho sp. (in: thermotogales)]MCD6104638.1 hypothetical protein [Thermosipho sp. (in: thermotogales)]